MRPSWKGYLTVNLVSFQVQAYNAFEPGSGEIHFNQLHAPDHNRIRYQKVCPAHGEVSKDEIVLGYEYAKGKYVEIDPEELERARTKREKALAIETFVDPKEIDPVYFEGRAYYLEPVGSHSVEPYALLQDAMTKLNRWGVGHVVFSGKDQLVALRPIDGVLSMAMLNYHDQIRPASLLKIEKPKLLPKKEQLAKQLIEATTEDDFDLAKYRDEYQDKLRELIEAKIEGKEIVAPKEEEQPEVINLMDALRKSVDQASKSASQRKRVARRKAPRRAKKRAS